MRGVAGGPRYGTISKRCVNRWPTRKGAHTLRAVVTDEAGQVSANTCEAGTEVKTAFPFFLGGYFGKERLTHDEAEDHTNRSPFTPFSRCSPIAGFELGVQPKIGENDRFGEADEADHAHFASAPRTDERVDFVHPADQLRPSAPESGAVWPVR